MGMTKRPDLRKRFRIEAELSAVRPFHRGDCPAQVHAGANERVHPVRCCSETVRSRTNGETMRETCHRCKKLFLRTHRWSYREHINCHHPEMGRSKHLPGEQTLPFPEHSDQVQER